MQDKEAEEFRDSTAIRDIWQYFRKDRLALFCLYIFLALIWTALFSSVLSPYNSNAQFVGKELLPPSWVTEGTVTYFFGTDDIGRDLFSRMLRGTTYTFGSAVIVVFFIAVIGGILGILAGMSQGLKARVLGHFLDAFLVVPILLSLPH